jgi:hypothetical protein
VGLEKKLISQATKKSMKHNARLPRTAGLKTLSELSASLRKAGLDPSRIEQRAALIAKAKGLGGKRKRDEEMDVDEEGENEDGEDGEGGGDWMDVDEEDNGGSQQKRRKSNTGATVTSTGKHAPRTNRQTAGMRDQTQVSKAVKLRNLGQRERNMHARAGESDRAIKVKMVSFHDHTKRGRGDFNTGRSSRLFVAEALVFWQTKSGKDSETMSGFVHSPSLAVCFASRFSRILLSLYRCLSLSVLPVSVYAPVTCPCQAPSSHIFTSPSHESTCTISVQVVFARVYMVKAYYRYAYICRVTIHQVSRNRFVTAQEVC